MSSLAFTMLMEVMESEKQGAQEHKTEDKKDVTNAADVSTAGMAKSDASHTVVSCPAEASCPIESATSSDSVTCSPATSAANPMASSSADSLVSSVIDSVINSAVNSLSDFDSSSVDKKKNIKGQSFFGSSGRRNKLKDGRTYGDTEFRRIAERGKIIGLHLAGKSNSEIAARLETSAVTVRKWIKRYEEEGNLAAHLRPGRHKLLSAEQREAIVNVAKQDPLKPATAIRNELQLTISVKTVRRVLQDAGIRTNRPSAQKSSPKKAAKAGCPKKRTPKSPSSTPKSKKSSPKKGANPSPDEVYAHSREAFSPSNDMYARSRESYSPLKESYSSSRELYSPSKQTYSPSKEMYPPSKEMYPPSKDAYLPPQAAYQPHIIKKDPGLTIPHHDIPGFSLQTAIPWAQDATDALDFFNTRIKKNTQHVSQHSPIPQPSYHSLSPYPPQQPYSLDIKPSSHHQPM